MEIWAYVAAGIAAISAIILLLRLASVRRALREIDEELEEKLSVDTNTLISVSSRDKYVLRHASGLNKQLRALREERLRLQSGNTELTAAVTNISHDLRTPLTAICGYLDLLEREEKSADAERYLAVIRERAGAMRSLTEELFRYSVISSGADELSLSRVCLNDELEKSLSAQYAELAGAGIVPLIAISEERIERRLDPSALSRILANILSNAVKYSAGDLSLSLTPDGTMTFENSAPDLDGVQTGRLFDRFYTVESARGSTGLGLSIAKLLTERMGGKVSAAYAGGRLNIVLRFNSAACK